MPYHSFASGKHLHGLHSVLAYRNCDGELSGTNCGLAAAATVLRYRELFSEDTLALLEKRFPPDVFFGLFGTSKTRVREILSAYQCPWHEVEGKHALKHAIQHQQPALVMLSLPGHLAAGHWDEHHVHLTNYRSHHDRMKWGTFLAA